jgi:hypothetical protein
MFKVISSSSTNYHVRKSRGGVLVVYFRKQACCYYRLLLFINRFFERKLVKFVAKISMCFKLHALKQNRKNRFLEVCRV